MGDEVENRQWIFNDITKKKVELSMLGVPLEIQQDNESMHVGTTVWDSSMVLAKFLERNAEVEGGEYARERLAGKRVIELGAGCGIAGIAMAILGCDVLLTDIPAVLPILKRNVKRSMVAARHLAQPLAGGAAESSGPRPGLSSARSAKRAAKKGEQKPHAVPAQDYPLGKARVQQLNWGKAADITSVKPPYEIIVATDVVYLEEIIDPLLETLLALSDESTTVFFGYEIRSATAHAIFWPKCRQLFHVDQIPHEMMHPDYEDTAIDVFILRKKVG